MVVPLLALAMLLAVASAFYWGGDRWGSDHTQTVQVIGNGGTDSAGHTIDVVRIDEPGFHRHWGFFPFAFLGPLLGLLIVFAILRAVFFRVRWHGHHRYEFAHDAWHRHDGGLPQPGNGESFEDWHRRQHPTNGEKPGIPSDS